MLNVYSFNENAINCYKKVGFKEFGRRRNCVMKKMKDIVYISVMIK